MLLSEKTIGFLSVLLNVCWAVSSFMFLASLLYNHNTSSETYSAFILITVKNNRSLKFSLCHLQAFWKWHCLRKLKKNKKDEMRWLWLLRFFNRFIARTERCERKYVLPHNLPDYFSIIVGNIYKHWDLHILILMFMKYIQQTATVNPGLLYLHALLTTFL